MPAITRRIKALSSYSALARFHREAKRAGEIPRDPSIPSPYAYSPEWTVYAWRGLAVCVVETKHRHFTIFEVDPAALSRVFADGRRAGFTTQDSAA